MSVAILRVTRVPLDMRKHIIRIMCVPLNIINLYPTAHVSLGVYFFIISGSKCSYPHQRGVIINTVV